MEINTDTVYFTLPGILLASYIKGETSGIYLVLIANDKLDADKKLSTLPYYPYMKIEIIPLR